MITIRQMTPDDAAMMYRYRRVALATSPEAFGSTVAEHDKQDVSLTRSRLESSKPGAENIAFMAFEGETPAGMLGIVREARDKMNHIAFIWGMFVSPEFRGQGVGRKLMTAAIDAGKAMGGVRQIKLTVISDNPAARHLYGSLGFEEFGVEPCALIHEERCYDEVYMILKLQSAGASS